MLILGAVSFRYFTVYAATQIRTAQYGRLIQIERDLLAQLDQIEVTTEALALGASDLDLDRIGRSDLSSLSTIETVREIQDRMSTITQTNPLVDTVYYVDADRQFVITSDRYSVAVSDHHDGEWLASLPPDLRDISYAPVRSIPTDQPEQSYDVLSMIVPTGELIALFSGYFIVNVNAASVNRWLAGHMLEDEHQVLVANESGEVLFASKQQDVAPRVSDRMLDPFRNGAGRDSFVRLGKQLYYLHDSSVNWFFLMGLPAADYFVFLRQISFTMMLLMLPLLVLSFLAAALVSDRIYHPVHRLLGVIEKEMPGTDETKNEVDRISHAFSRVLSEKAGIQAMLETNSQAIKESTLRRFLAGETLDGQAVRRRLEAVGYRLPHGLFAAAMILPTGYGGAHSPVESGIGQSVLIEMYERQSKEKASLYGTIYGTDRIALLVNASGREAIEQILGSVSESIIESAGFHPFAAVGGIYDSIDGVPESFEEANSILHAWLTDSAATMFFDDLSEPEPEAPGYPHVVEEQLLRAVQRQEYDRIDLLTEEFIASLMAEGATLRSTIEGSVLLMLARVIRATSPMGEPVRPHDENWVRELLSLSPNVQETTSWLSGFLKETAAAAVESREHELRSVILGFIRTNYSRDISLQEIADFAGTSYAYMRRIYKTVFGQSFLEHIHTYRIDMAKDRLVETNDRISDIALVVGYTNIARFNRNFKRYAGCLPSEYRRRTRASLVD